MSAGSVCRHLKIVGRVGISRFFHVVSQGPRKFATQPIKAMPEFELRSNGKLSIVCFRYRPPGLGADEEAVDALNKKIMERVQSDGTAFLTNTTLAGRFVLRACILHYGTTEQDIDTMLRAVLEAAGSSAIE